MSNCEKCPYKARREVTGTLLSEHGDLVRQYAEMNENGLIERDGKGYNRNTDTSLVIQNLVHIAFDAIGDKIDCSGPSISDEDKVTPVCPKVGVAEQALRDAFIRQVFETKSLQVNYQKDMGQYL